MSKNGPIILIEDDPDDLDVIVAALKEIGFANKPICFTNAKDALDYLCKTDDQPFVILCDIYMQVMNGLELRNFINHNDFLRKKSIPFIFYTAAVSPDIVNAAYDLTVQGFFKKPQTFTEMKSQLLSITNYWINCYHPNGFTS